MFTSRRWHNYFSAGSEGVVFPKEPPKGTDSFDDTGFGAAASPSD